MAFTDPKILPEVPALAPIFRVMLSSDLATFGGFIADLLLLVGFLFLIFSNDLFVGFGSQDCQALAGSGNFCHSRFSP